MKLFMITGLGSARNLVSDKKGAFYQTLEEFSKHWERIDIIAPKVQFPIPNSQFPNKSNTKILFGNVYVHISPWPLIFHPIWFIKKALEIYKQQKFDLMTVQEFPPFYNGIAARLLWNKIKVPYILEIHHIPGYPKSANIKEEIYRIFTKLFIEFDSSKATAVRVVNQGEVPEFLISNGVPKEKIVYIPSMYIDLEVYRPQNVTKEYDLIFIGRLEENKGVNLLLEAIRNIKLQIPNIKCLIVGEGSLLNHCKLEIVNFKLQDNVLLYGWAKDTREIAALINKSRILVMPSYNEGGPRVVPEALACGVPVLATPVGIVPGLLKNGLGGEIIPWNADDIATKAKDLLNDQAKYDKYGHSGPEIAAQFEKRTAIKNYAEELKKLTK